LLLNYLFKFPFYFLIYCWFLKVKMFYFGLLSLHIALNTCQTETQTLSRLKMIWVTISICWNLIGPFYAPNSNQMTNWPANDVWYLEGINKLELFDNNSKINDSSIVNTYENFFSKYFVALCVKNVHIFKIVF
jgi:hypothetical protein